MSDFFSTGVRPAVDAYLLEKSKERRSYGEYWPASSAGFCMQRVIFDRLQVPYVKEDARKQRVFEVGHIFHEWMQRITQDTKLSVAQETELQDETLMVRGHIDDLVVIESIGEPEIIPTSRMPREGSIHGGESLSLTPRKHQLILYDYKTQNSRAFSYQKDRPMSHFHKMQVGTYTYMLRNGQLQIPELINLGIRIEDLSEARILKISKDDLRMSEQQLLWSPDLEKEIVGYWSTLNGYWKNKRLPFCTCDKYEGGFFAKQEYNPYFYKDEPCSVEWATQNINLTGWKI